MLRGDQEFNKKVWALNSQQPCSPLALPLVHSLGLMRCRTSVAWSCRSRCCQWNCGPRAFALSPRVEAWLNKAERLQWAIRIQNHWDKVIGCTTHCGIIIRIWKETHRKVGLVVVLPMVRLVETRRHQQVVSLLWLVWSSSHAQHPHARRPAGMVRAALGKAEKQHLPKENVEATSGDKKGHEPKTEKRSPQRVLPEPILAGPEVQKKGMAVIELTELEEAKGLGNLFWVSPCFWDEQIEGCFWRFIFFSIFGVNIGKTLRGAWPIAQAILRDWIIIDPQPESSSLEASVIPLISLFEKSSGYGSKFQVPRSPPWHEETRRNIMPADSPLEKQYMFCWFVEILRRVDGKDMGTTLNAEDFDWVEAKKGSSEWIFGCRFEWRQTRSEDSVSEVKTRSDFHGLESTCMSIEHVKPTKTLHLSTFVTLGQFSFSEGCGHPKATEHQTHEMHQLSFWFKRAPRRAEPWKLTAKLRRVHRRRKSRRLLLVSSLKQQSILRGPKMNSFCFERNSMELLIHHFCLDFFPFDLQWFSLDHVRPSTGGRPVDAP